MKKRILPSLAIASFLQLLLPTIYARADVVAPGLFNPRSSNSDIHWLMIVAIVVLLIVITVVMVRIFKKRK